nr:hypothetical protein [Bacteroidota bacterium]
MKIIIPFFNGAALVRLLLLTTLCLNIAALNNSAIAAVYPNPYDIVYHRISIQVDPGTSGAISNGSVTTYFNTTSASVNKIGFDLNQSMTVDAVVYHGATLLAANSTHTSNFLLITLPAFIDIAGTLDSITVN